MNAHTSVLILIVALFMAASVSAQEALFGVYPPAVVDIPDFVVEQCDPGMWEAEGAKVATQHFLAARDLPRGTPAQAPGAQALARLWFRSTRREGKPVRPDASATPLFDVVLGGARPAAYPTGSQLFSQDAAWGVAASDFADRLTRRLTKWSERKRADRQPGAAAQELLRQLKTPELDSAQAILLGPDGKVVGSVLVTGAEKGFPGCDGMGDLFDRFEVVGMGGKGTLLIPPGTDRAVPSATLGAALAAAGAPLVDLEIRAVPARLAGLWPVLQDWKAPATKATDPQAFHRTDAVDAAHEYISFDDERAFAGGTHVGTARADDGSIRLQPGATQGAWVSEVVPTRKAFDAASVGLLAKVPEGSEVQVMVRSYNHMNSPTQRRLRRNRNKQRRSQRRSNRASRRSRRQRTGGFSQWRPASRGDQQFRLGNALQVMVILLAAFSQGNAGGPRFQGATFSPGLFGTGYANGRRQRSVPGQTFRNGTPQRQPTPAVRPKTPAVANNSGAFTGASLGSLKLITRAEWGAAPQKRSAQRHTADKLVVHHTAGPASSYKGASTIKSIQNFHQNTRGWNDIGYHYLIGPDGALYEGADPGGLGTHVGGANTGRLGVSLIGHFSKNDTPTPEALATLGALTRELARSRSIQSSGITGHQDHTDKDCPGKRLYSRLPELRSFATR